jgi:site-specific DNA-methyltransferase (cytosine-N4-specific)
MKSLLKNGYQIRKRPSNHDISRNFLNDNAGSIPSNLLGFASEPSDGIELIGDKFDDLFDNIVAVSNTASKDRYLDACRGKGIKPHNARFPRGLAAFFIEFLTKPGQTVLDPFAGSNTTGEVAETLARRWISCELDAEGSFAGTYVRASAFRFSDVKLEPAFKVVPSANWTAPGTRVRPRSK